MILIFFLLCFRRRSKYDHLSIGPHEININNLKNASAISIKSPNYFNISAKYYIIFIRDTKSFFKSNLSTEFKNIFRPYNCITPLYFRAYLFSEDMQKLQKSKYLSIFEVPKQLKFHDIQINSKTTKNEKKIENNSIIQYLVQATSDFPIYFNNYGVINKVFDELYSFTLIRGNQSRSDFNNYINNVKSNLLDSDFVFKFEISPKINSFNRFSVGFVQTGTYEMKNYNNMIHSYNPLHDISITGTNEVVTISDSGVSPNLAWFIDPDRPIYPYNKYEESQRKIVYYSSYNIRGSEDATDFSGHGTHVACTVLGNSINSNKIYSLFNGAAPDAKAIIIDLEDENGNMHIDIELSQTLNKMKSYKSYINTNSWGAEADSLTVNFLYNVASVSNPEFLFIFASGNYQRYQSVYSPGSAKNVLTVGALGGLQSSYLNSSQSSSNKNVQFEVMIDNEKQKLFIAHSLNYNDNGDSNYIGYGFKSIISEMTSKNSLNTIYNAPILLYDKELSDFTDKAVIVSNCNEEMDSLSKNAKVIIVKSSNDIPISSCNNANLQQNAFGIELPLTNSQLQLLLGKLLTITPQIVSNDYPSVSYYSSRGPNYIGAIKPEIVAPGTNITSASHIQSSTPQLSVMSGTSMSTPLVAGAMATLRQYLREKRGLSSNQIHSHLMKAIAIASADKPNPKVPDVEYGFGRLNLANVIPELSSDQSNSGLKMEFLTDLTFKSESVYTFVFEVTAKDKYDIRVAFSYLDDSSQFYNDLIIKANLNVQTPERTLLFPLGDSIEDSFSTVERIYIPKEELSIGIYTVIISTSASDFNSVINASIVVSGSVRNFRQVTDLEASASIQNIFDWSQYCKVDNTVSSSSSGDVTSSANNYHECNCNKFSSGLLCQHKSKPISFGIQDVVRLNPFETCYYYSTLDVDAYQNLLFSWEQSNNKQNYIMLRLNIGQSKKRLSNYQYSFYSNKTVSNVQGPTNIEGGAILYEKGTLLFFTYTNFGNSQVTLTISSSIQEQTKTKSTPIGVSLSVSLYLLIIVFIIIVIIIIVITCRRKKRRTAQIDGATSSSVSSYSGENHTIGHRRRRVANADQQRTQEEQTFQPQPFHGPLPSYTYGNQVNINPYFNNVNPNYDPNAFPNPASGSVSFNPLDDGYFPTGTDSNSEQAPQYFAPTNANYYNYENGQQNPKTNDPDGPQPINPYDNYALP